MQKAPDDGVLKLGPIELSNRLILGTGKYRSFEEMQQAHRAAQTEMVTVALRRVPLGEKNFKSIIDYIDRDRIHLLPNTAGAHSAEEALRLAQIAAAMSLTHLKLEVMGDAKTLLPDPVETLRGLQLIKEHQDTRDLFVMVYTSDDPVLALKLHRAGADCIMPAGSPIGSGRGIQNKANMQLLMSLLPGQVPLILDAGVGCASDVTQAFELGFDAVLLNSAVAGAEHSAKMAEAMYLAARAGRAGYLAGRIDKKLYAQASSPAADFHG